MRILYVINGFVRGGAELGLLHLLQRGFFDHTDSLILGITGGNEELIADIRACGVPVEVLSERPDMHLLDMVRAVPALYSRLKSFQPDLLILSLPQANIVGRLVSRFYPRLTVAAFEHSVHYSKFIYGPLLKLLSPRVDVLFADTPETGRQIEQLSYARPAPHKLVIPLVAFTSVPAEPRSSYELHQPLRLLSVGRLTPVKNQMCLVDALALLQARGIEASLTILGEGEEINALLRRARHLKLTDAVFLPGYSSDWTNRAGRYDIFVLPSLREGLSIVALEAMSQGMPVIATNAGGLVDYGRQRENMLKLDQPTAEAIADAVAELAADPQLREKIGRNAVNTVAERFSEETVRKQIKDAREALDRIVADKKVRAGGYCAPL